MNVAVVREAGDETRVALVPEIVSRLSKAGTSVALERGAGTRAAFSDEQYADAGAKVGDKQSTLQGADILVKVGRPTPDELQTLPSGSAV